ncbi:hypothetical protein GWI33_012759 [Rhynchophorus ferrugineus]|uniref:C2H2-type domain-containing protein n=1 Tax=Rhynchophorus ferrugineus TaxID=354439 RepID=A0A834IW31_RHYFE|nr:hypothetical protein GWI33_012759 [Rhynchophorus ferrugineus]
MSLMQLRRKTEEPSKQSFVQNTQYYSVNPRTVFNCPKCNKPYKHPGSIKNHLRNECGVEPRFQCDICLRKFRQKKSLILHAFNIHNQGPMP